MLKILIIEDDQRISKFLEIELLREGYAIDSSFDGKEALEKVNNNFYNLILLDLMIPSISGEELCKIIREKSDVPIIVLSAKNSIFSKVQVIDLGADDYLTKPFNIEELFARIRLALRHKKQYKNNGFEEFKELRVNRDTKEVFVNDLEVILTKREYNLLEFFILNKDIALSRDKIVDSVWGYDFEGNLNIVDACLKNLRKKLKLKTSLIHAIRGVGYIFKG